ncbi:MAG: hypothetical protein WED05_10745 [Candidatus Atabeyarchaeum deiterrae]
MKKSIAFCLVVFSIFIMLAATSNPTWAANYSNVGVKVGDYADYTASVGSFNYTRCRVYVYGIVGTDVTLNLTYYDANGKAYPQLQLQGDIYIGSGYFLLFPALIAGGLGKDDPIYSGSSAKINETVTMTFASESRAVNHLLIPNVFYWDYYWDQATGFPVKVNNWFLGWTNLTMTSTTLWSPPSISLTTILFIANLIEVALIVVVFYVGKRVGRRK